ncbi:transposase [Streptomyces sp. NBC_00690]|uniref:transposase n=1 Tax=Streptomyces sp. NBC_00690 TaxID=2975808 RepID=UPI003FA77D47
MPLNHFRERTGAPWCDLPARFGKWKTLHDRLRRWWADDTWDRIPSAIQADVNTEGRLDSTQTGVDSTFVVRNGGAPTWPPC